MSLSKIKSLELEVAELKSQLALIRKENQDLTDEINDKKFELKVQQKRSKNTLSEILLVRRQVRLFMKNNEICEYDSE